MDNAVIRDTHDFDGMGLETPLADLEALREFVRGKRDEFPERTIDVVEVGTWAGRTARAMADAAHDVRVFCVDHWRGTRSDTTSLMAEAAGHAALFKTFMRNMGKRLWSTVIPCFGASLTWAEAWPSPIDVLFLDAGHRYEEVWRDLTAWLKHVRHGGIVCGHDYGQQFSGVKKAVDELVGPVKVAGTCIWWTTMNAQLLLPPDLRKKDRTDVPT